MNHDLNQTTSPSLLERVGQNVNDQAAWDEFVGSMVPKSMRGAATGICKNPMPRTSPKKCSCNWSRNCAVFNTIHSPFSGLAENGRPPYLAEFPGPAVRAGLGSGDSAVWQKLNTVEAKEDLEQQLEDLFDREVLEEAMTRVQRRVAPHTWEAFRLLTFEGLSGADVAPRVGMQVAMV